jgi:hypothetical protein
VIRVHGGYALGAGTNGPVADVTVRGNSVAWQITWQVTWQVTTKHRGVRRTGEKQPGL